MTRLAEELAELNDPAFRAQAVAAARGDQPFDILISGGTLVDVVTGERRAADIGLVGPLIASVHAPGSRSDARTVIDAGGGFITHRPDRHAYACRKLDGDAFGICPARFLPRGVTTVCWDPHEFGNVVGLDGVRWAVEAAEKLPLRFMVLAPSCVPSPPPESKWQAPISTRQRSPRC